MGRYVSDIETKLQQVKDDIAKLGSNASRKDDLVYLQNKYTRQNEYFKYLLNNPCEYQASQQPVVSTPGADPKLASKLIEFAPTAWFANQISENYINGANATNSTCPK